MNEHSGKSCWGVTAWAVVCLAGVIAVMVLARSADGDAPAFVQAGAAG